MTTPKEHPLTHLPPDDPPTEPYPTSPAVLAAWTARALLHVHHLTDACTGLAAEHGVVVDDLTIRRSPGEVVATIEYDHDIGEYVAVFPERVAS